MMTLAMKSILVIAGIALVIGTICMGAVLIEEYRENRRNRHRKEG